MVGDSAPDMEAGRRAGVKICGVRYGYGDVAQMHSSSLTTGSTTFASLSPRRSRMHRKVYRTKLKPEERRDEYIQAHRNFSSDLMRRYKDAGMSICAVYMLGDDLVLITEAKDHDKTRAILAEGSA